MRIVAGAWRGRAIEVARGTATRPTSDRARQTLFDMLAHAPWSRGFTDAQVLDVFAGTGALGLEALSRGAASATFIENGRASLAVLHHNVTFLGATARATIIAADATRPPRARAPADLVFLDPPYGHGLAAASLPALQAAGFLAPEAVVVIETGRDEPAIEFGDRLAERSVGKARITVHRLAEERAPRPTLLRTPADGL